MNVWELRFEVEWNVDGRLNRSGANYCMTLIRGIVAIDVLLLSIRLAVALAGVISVAHFHRKAIADKSTRVLLCI